MTRQIMLYCGWLEMMRSSPSSPAIRSAAANYVRDVRSGTFPGSSESFR